MSRFSEKKFWARRVIAWTVASCILFICVGTAMGQRRGGTATRPSGPPVHSPAQAEKSSAPQPLPSDKRLLALHIDFVKKATLLADEYQKKKEYNKAIDCYQEILKLVPEYKDAKDKLTLLRKNEMVAQSAAVEIRADKGWQPTNIMLVPGKPISIRATGQWKFSFTREMGADGMTIPKELQEYNLGCLIGMIDTGNPEDAQPFVIGSGKSFIAEKPGHLYLRMYNAEPNDSTGSLKVEFMGTFVDKNPH